MFDTIFCRANLPAGTPALSSGPDTEFQTRQFDCELNVYEITADGRLVVLARTGDGWRSVRCDPPEPVEYHGDLEFYRGRQSPHGYDMVVYTARFTEGRLVWIREVSRTRTTPGKIVDLTTDVQGVDS